MIIKTVKHPELFDHEKLNSIIGTAQDTLEESTAGAQWLSDIRRWNEWLKPLRNGD